MSKMILFLCETKRKLLPHIMFRGVRMKNGQAPPWRWLHPSGFSQYRVWIHPNPDIQRIRLLSTVVVSNATCYMHGRYAFYYEHRQVERPNIVRNALNTSILSYWWSNLWKIQMHIVIFVAVLKNESKTVQVTALLTIIAIDTVARRIY